MGENVNASAARTAVGKFGGALARTPATALGAHVIRKLLERAGIPYQARVLVGPVAETIVAQAKERRCDMIFVGTRGMGAAGNMLLGSTATKVLHLSSVPVLVAK